MKLISSLRNWQIFDRRLMVIGAGFLGILGLTALVIGVAMARMNSIAQQLDYVVHNLNARTAIIADVRENVYQRITSMRDMLLMKDAFEIDAEAQRFYGYGKHVEQVLQSLGNLLNDQEDREALGRFYEAAKQGTEAQNEVIDLLMSGKSVSVIQPQLEQAFTAQRQVLESLQSLHIKYEEHAHTIVDESLEKYEFTRTIVYVLGMLEVVLAVIISIIVTRVLHYQMRDVENERLKFRTLFETSTDAVLILKGSVVIEWNRRALDWLDQQNTGTLSNVDILQLSPEKQPDGRASRIIWNEKLEEVKGHGGGVFEWLFHDRNNGDFHSEISLTPLGKGNNSLYQIVIRDVTERWLVSRKMEYQATHDMLTGLANRREFEKKLQESLDHVRLNNTEHVLCMLDLDRFKQVNDLGGHDMGDELLKQITALIKSKIRNHDLLARLGGDEFAIILDSCPLARAQTIAESICSAVNTYRLVGNGHIFQVGVSIGLVPVNLSSGTMAQIVKQADSACYEAKNAGRGCVRVAKGHKTE